MLRLVHDVLKPAAKPAAKMGPVPTNGVRVIEVLVVEDHPGDLATIRRWLRHLTVYEAFITHAACLRDAETALSSKKFDLALIDYSLCDGNGTSLIPKLDGCPAILLSSLLADDIEFEAVRLGAAACIEKDDMTPRVLENTIRLTLREAELQSRLKLSLSADNDADCLKFRMAENALLTRPAINASASKQDRVKRTCDAGGADKKNKRPGKDVS